MKKHRILISGPMIASDDILYYELLKESKVEREWDNSKVESTIRERKVDLILLEIPENVPSDVEIVKNVKEYDPGIEIVIINRDRDTIIKALTYKAADAFRTDGYREFYYLVVEKLNVILTKMNKAKLKKQV